jgi:hypothetical protein
VSLKNNSMDNTEQITFLHGLKIKPCDLGPNLHNRIDQIINETTFIKEKFCVLKINDIKLLNVKVTNGQSDCVANLEINAQCIVPREDKIFNGIVTMVIEHKQLSVVTVEGKIDVIVRGETIKSKNDFATVKIGRSTFKNRKILCTGIFI